MRSQPSPSILLAVASGYYDYVLVAGGEKMREVTGWRATDFVASMTHPTAEYVYGVTLPGMAGMFTRLYMEKYGVTREMLVAVALKNQDTTIEWIKSDPDLDPIRTDQLAPPPEMEQVDMSDQDRRAIEGMLEGLGYL